MAGKFKVTKIKLDHAGISNLLTSDAVIAAVEAAAEGEGEIVKEYIGLDRKNHGRRIKCVVDPADKDKKY